VGLKKSGAAVVKAGVEKLKEAHERRLQVELAKKTIDQFPSELQEALNDGVFTQEEESALRFKLEKAGLDWNTIVQQSIPIARSFVSHVLADAVSDGEISNEEERNLWRYVQLFGIQDLSHTIHWTIHRVRTIAELEQNRLPDTLSTVGINWLRSGESLFFSKDASRATIRSNYSPALGRFHITSERISFVAENSPVEYKISQIREAGNEGPNTLKVITAHKGRESFFIADAEIAAALINCMNRLNNRTASTYTGDTLLERKRISKEVRNAVWIRDQGLCLECGANDYLEFDHIIPVSRGGSNSLENVQLLCRRCNSSKSNKI
jgi:hypothetical protein